MKLSKYFLLILLFQFKSSIAMSINGYVSSSDDESVDLEDLPDNKSDEDLEDKKSYFEYVVPITSDDCYKKFLSDQVREVSVFDTKNIIFTKELLVTAISDNGVIAVQRILEKGVNIEEARDENGETPLIQAAAKGYVDILTILLDKGADVNSVTKIKGKRRRKHLCFNGRTALMAAAYNRHINVLDILLKCPNIKINITDRRGRNALWYACKKPDLRIIKKLVESGIELDECILVYIIRKRIFENKKLEIIKFLIFQGADYQKIIFQNIRSLTLRNNIKEICAEYEQVVIKELCDETNLIPDIINNIILEYLNFKKIEKIEKNKSSGMCVIL